MTCAHTSGHTEAFHLHVRKLLLGTDVRDDVAFQRTAWRLVVEVVAGVEGAFTAIAGDGAEAKASSPIQIPFVITIASAALFMGYARCSDQLWAQARVLYATRSLKCRGGNVCVYRRGIDLIRQIWAPVIVRIRDRIAWVHYIRCIGIRIYCSPWRVFSATGGGQENKQNTEAEWDTGHGTL